MKKSGTTVPSTRTEPQQTPKNWQNHRFGLTPERWQALKEKPIWITGAGTGFGRCLAIALGLAGAHLFLTGRRESKLRETINEIERLIGSKPNCSLVMADLSNPGQIQNACRLVEKSCNGLHGLINNAAMPAHILDNPLQDESVSFWDNMMATNVRAPWLLTREIFPHLLKNRSARILFISSEAGWSFARGFGIYNVSKAALNSLTANLAEEYKQTYPSFDIQINAIDPGQARTEMNQFSNEDPFTIVSIALALLSHPPKGPNGKFFHKDGRHLPYAYSSAYEKSLL